MCLCGSRPALAIPLTLYYMGDGRLSRAGDSLDA